MNRVEQESESLKGFVEAVDGVEDLARRIQAEVYAKDLLEETEDRFDHLDCDYLNSREANELSFLMTNIEAGIDAQKRLRWFLDNVPVGKYDSNRRKYRYQEPEDAAV